jgi:methyl-accepting chemotaxis protein
MKIFQSIRGRLMASVFLLSAVAVGIGVFGLLKATDLRDRMYLIAGPIAGRARLTNEVDLNLINFIRMQKNVILSANPEQQQKFLGQQKDYEKAFDQSLAEWDAIASEKDVAEIRDLRVAWEEYKTMNRDVVRLATSGQAAQAQAMSVTRSFEIFARIRKPLDASKKRSVDELAQQKQETTVLYRNLCWSLGLAIALGVGVGLTFAWRVVSETANRLNRVRDHVHDMAEGEGDLTRRIKIIHQDELGEVGESINRFLEGIEEIISGVAENTRQIVEATAQLESSAHHIAESSRHQDNKAAEVSMAMHRMANSVAEVSRNSELATQTAQQAGQAAVGGSKTVDNTVSIMREIADAAHESTATIQNLDQSSDQIGRIVAVIEEIAGQTGLLALNAAIEAARAGEQGRGFAVVAGEVRRLAERTSEATKEIGQMIAGVQQTTQQAVSAMEESSRKVAHGVEVAQQCSDALSQITARANEVESMIAQIAATTEEQNHSTGEVGASMESMTVMVRDASTSAQDSAEACQNLSHLAADLDRLVGRFKTGATAGR